MSGRCRQHRSLDPRHDHLTGVLFAVSATGVQRDGELSNDTNEDTSWDAVWSSAVSFDDEGWSAELRIPFSQLRFNAGENQTWGINAARFIRRRNETAWLELVPKNENGQASRMAHLTNLEGIRPKRHLELVPYTAARSEYIAPPRRRSVQRRLAHVCVGRARRQGRRHARLTLDATINPDFGQAEVDPAVVNLSAFETFYDEKRRFFIEGAEIFNNFGQGGSNNFFGFNTSDPDLLLPAHRPAAAGGRRGRLRRFASRDDDPRCGQADGQDGQRLEHRTDRCAHRQRGRQAGPGGHDGRMRVEPLTNYFVGRVRKDFSRGGAGLLATSVNRDLDTPLLTGLLTRQALVVGGDGYFFFDRRRTGS